MTRSASRPISLSLAVALLVGPALSACETVQNNPNQAAGTLGGAALGGFVGSQFGGSPEWTAAATGLGVLIGAAIGNEAGSALDDRDRRQLQQAQSRAYTAPIGETVSWNNPNSGNSGTFTPLRDGYTNTGRYCRQFRTTVTIGGRLEDATGTACRNSRGEWEIIDSRG
ncbi:RT0821/Lpp0805 family surface protein [Roseospira visakhapatnamensis]|uniref:17 kDa surface antigen n=1 Tax=Roseospira visakhapatnamensis TaxID=390880 RepID=A0A7W6W8V7_9PROT|nr:RT0821/Lpp0805 family surface protein [Roseospira visakhapatnamensis]MBB4265218.1 surface antigen [Roseospira visakhapatnamensis]